jgi:AMP-binding enzyme
MSDVSAQERDASPAASPLVTVERRSDGTLILRSPIPMGTIEPSVCVYLRSWAASAPERIFLAQRRGDGEWHTVDYQTMWSRVQSVGQALLDRGLVKGERVAPLSGNSIEHAIVAFATMSCGLVVSPVSPNYRCALGRQRAGRGVRAARRAAIAGRRRNHGQGLHQSARRAPQSRRCRRRSLFGRAVWCCDGDGERLSAAGVVGRRDGLKSLGAAAAAAGPARFWRTAHHTSQVPQRDSCVESSRWCCTAAAGRHVP